MLLSYYWTTTTYYCNATRYYCDTISYYGTTTTHSCINNKHAWAVMGHYWALIGHDWAFMGHHWAFVGHYCAFARALQTQGEADDFRKLNPKSFGGRVDKGWVSNSGTLHHNPNHFMEGLWCRSGKHTLKLYIL